MTDADNPHDKSSDDLCVSHVPLFRGLSRAQQEEVAKFAHPVRLNSNEFAYSAGAEVSQLLVVHTGKIKISRTSPTGQEQVIRVLGPGDFIGESTFLTGARPDHSAQALEDAEMCVFRHRDLGALIERKPLIGLRMLEGVSRRLEDTESRLAAVTGGNVGSRLAEYLLSLPGKSIGEGQFEVTLPMAKKDVASLLAATPESLSRQLRKLSDANVIAAAENNRIVILDAGALGDIAEQTVKS